MDILNRFQQAIQFVLEGVGRIFEPSDDAYPATGIQPFEGDPYDEKKQTEQI